MRLYNTLSQTVEHFQPRGDQVSLYVCGITPYDTTHLGHAFTYTTIDILVRLLEYRGLKVRYVQNVTDIDDDILKRAREVGEDWKTLGDRWTAHFIQDMQVLNVRPPDYYPRATDVIPQIVQTVGRLLETGVAYERDGNVYFDISAWPEFGKLCKLPHEKMLPIANERGNKPDDPRKKDPLDFVLWQSQAPGEPAWVSPWGPGRPGWHIECSTMSTQLLGSTIDIHSGGADLCFPHHECEIAQVEPINGQLPFVRHWFHIAMVYHEGEKMSKSLGNLVMVRDLLKTFTPDALRLYLGSHHYRREWNHEEDALQEAQKLSAKASVAVSLRRRGESRLDPSTWQEAFVAAMEDDLNTEKAALIFEELVDELLTAAGGGLDVWEAQRALRDMGSIFGLRLDSTQPETRVISGWNMHLKRFVGEDEVFNHEEQEDTKGFGGPKPRL